MLLRSMNVLIRQRTCYTCAAGNEKNIRTLVYIVDVLADRLLELRTGGPASPSVRLDTAQKIQSVNSFLFTTGLEDVDLFKLVRSIPQEPCSC